MSGMRMIFFSLVLLLGGLLDTEAISVKGIVGGNVVIQCSHSLALLHTKYFCKDPCDNKDVLIGSRDIGVNDKYSIQDNGNTFTVTISGLTEKDSGIYFCGIDRVVKDTFSRVDLTVKPRELEPTPEANTPKPDATSPQSTPVVIDPTDTLQGNQTTEMSFSEKLVYIMPSFGVILLALAMVLLIFYRCRKRDVQASPALPPPQPDLRSDRTSKHRESEVTLGPADYINVDKPKRISDYQSLDLSTLEDHDYCSLNPNQPKDRPLG